MSIFVTGDTHGPLGIQKLNTWNFPQQKELTKDDYVIILGDFGLIWDWYEGKSSKEEAHWLEWLENKNFTTLFIDGNHENFDRLYNYPVTEWNGGKVHKISPSIIHLMRDQYYTIDGTSFWTFGGAKSHDVQDGVLDPNDPEDRKKIAEWRYDLTKYFRILGRSWWPQEMPSDEEMSEGEKNLRDHNCEVDYILTHECPMSAYYLMGGRDNPDNLKRYLEQIQWIAKYKRWFFGHYHRDELATYSEICVYNKIIQVG